MSLPFRGLIIRLAIMTKAPLHDNEPITKMYEKILVVTVFKFEVVVNKKDHILNSLPSFSPKILKPAPYSLL
jgi:hypothetical protein